MKNGIQGGQGRSDEDIAEDATSLAVGLAVLLTLVLWGAIAWAVS